MVAMQLQLNFCDSTLAFPDGQVVQSLISDGGHLALDLKPARIPLGKTASAVSIFHVEEETFATEEAATEENPRIVDDVLRIHIQLGRATCTSMRRLLAISKQKVPGQMIRESIRKCARHRLYGKIQNPTMTHYIPPYSGHTVAMGVCFPVHRDRFRPMYYFRRCIDSSYRWILPQI